MSDPLFTQGGAPILEVTDGSNPGPGDFFLQQAVAPFSPAVNAGDVAASAAGLQGKTTDRLYTLDQAVVDLGFHFTPP